MYSVMVNSNCQISRLRGAFPDRYAVHPQGRLFYRGVTMSKKIPLTQGKFAIVDDEDYGELSKHKWCVDKTPYTYYAIRRVKRRGKCTTIRMHRFILNAKPGEDVDHRDSNGLKNTRDNLRICTRSQNVQNQRPRKDGSSRYKGVRWHKTAKKWQAQIVSNHKERHLGLFDNEIQAAQAYDIAAKELFGEFAYTNF